MPSRQHITLTGFSGVGKTTVANLVALRLGWQAIDADDYIEAQTGRAVPDIIAGEGEASFRAIEAAAFAELARRDRTIVAAGGGAPVFEPTRRAIVEGGLVIHLQASPAATEGRVASDDKERARPIRGNGSTGVARILDQRAALYAEADFIVATDVLTPSEVAVEVVRLYQGYAGRVLDLPGRLEALTRTPTVLPPVTDAPGAVTIIRTASSDYPVYADWGALERLGEYTNRATGSRRAFVISDEAVLSQWGETALSGLREAGLEAVSITLPPGDGSKSLEQAGRVYDWLASHRAERRDCIVALGGGMVGDFSGFIAGTYMRGMPFVQVPTSLLAMVDASIGGKTAVNHAGAKNIVGLFYQPRAVVAGVATLKTLPRRALVEGMGEVIKHALIRDPDMLATLEARLDDLMALEPELTADIIGRNMAIKGAVVSEDERETGGVRELLNYGHTLGHAFEAAGGYNALLHGEAVGAGMVAAAEIGKRAGITPPELVERQRKLIERAGLPTRPPKGIDRDRIRAALALDKKVVAGGQRWVLLEDVGHPIVRGDVPASIVEEVLDDLLAG
jgi:shikimate kinase/3-dehydroquinate synthase